VRGHLNLLAALALSTIGGCRTAGPAPAGPAVTAVAPSGPAPPCAARPLAFRPRPGVAYQARTQQNHDIYETRLAFTADGDENDRIRTFRYRIENADGERIRIRVDALVKTPRNEWRIDGTVEVSMDDGLTGTADLHVAGPGAPQINDYARHVSIVAAPDR
jgi:hypothetical protein